MKYRVTIKFEGSIDVFVDADSFHEARSKGGNAYEDADLNKATLYEQRICKIEDENGNTEEY